MRAARQSLVSCGANSKPQTHAFAEICFLVALFTSVRIKWGVYATRPNAGYFLSAPTTTLANFLYNKDIGYAAIRTLCPDRVFVDHIYKLALLPWFFALFFATVFVPFNK